MSQRALSLPWSGVLALALLVGCGADDAPAGDDGGVLDDSAAVQLTVKVTLETAEEDVVLAELATTEIDGEGYVKLSDVVAAAFPAENQGQLEADFEASDGFTPGMMDFCKELVPVDGATLAQGYLHPQSRNMRWDDSFAYPGCMSSDDLAIITLRRKP